MSVNECVPYREPAEGEDQGHVRGYDIFDEGGGRWGIERDDDQARFTSDSEAIWQCVSDAVHGDLYAQYVLWRALLQVGPEVNFASPSWARSAWETTPWQIGQLLEGGL
jgi:hypothetical protein